MKKTLLFLVLTVGQFLSFCGRETAATETAPLLTEKEMTFYMVSEEDAQTRSVWFIGDSDVPYVSLEDWAKLMPYLVRRYVRGDSPFALAYTKEGETGILTREDGYTVSFDCAEDRICFSDYDAFLHLQGDGMLIDVLGVDNSSTDGEGRLLRRREGSYGYSGESLVLEPGAYGIDMVADGDACYVPLQILSDFLLSYMYMNVFYNGEAVFFAVYNGLGAQDGYTPLGELFYSAAPRERSEEMAAFAYAELCLALDNLYGLKDTLGIDSFDALAEEAGLRDALMSTDPAVADEALYTLLSFRLNDLHSGVSNTSPLNRETDLNEINEKLGDGTATRSLFAQYVRYMQARTEAYPDGIPAYEEIGNTAYITFDQFSGIPKDTDYYATPPTAEAEDTAWRHSPTTATVPQSGHLPHLKHNNPEFLSLSLHRWAPCTALSAGTEAKEEQISFFSQSALPQIIRSTMFRITATGRAIPANHAKYRPIETGRSPINLPLCPFMANRKFFPFHRVDSIHTGSSAYAVFSCSMCTFLLTGVSEEYPLTVLSIRCSAVLFPRF